MRMQARANSRESNSRCEHEIVLVAIAGKAAIAIAGRAINAATAGRTARGPATGVVGGPQVRLPNRP